MTQAPKTLSALLQRELGEGLLAESRRQATLKNLIRESLPEALQSQMQHCGLRREVMTLEWSSAAAANLGRFFAPQLISTLKLRGVEVKEIKTRTRPSASRPAKPPNPRTPPSDEVIAHLESLALHLESDTLQNAFSQLAETLKQKRRRSF